MDIIFSLAPFARVLHHIPGRIRIRISTEAARYLSGDMAGISGVISGLPGIMNVRINPIIGSVLVEYDPKFFEPDLWERIVGINGNSEEKAGFKNELLERISSRLNR